jgi:hypothetical protein
MAMNIWGNMGNTWNIYRIVGHIYIIITYYICIYIWDMYGEIYEIKESIWKKYRTYMGKYGER